VDSDLEASIVSCFSAVAQRFADRIAIRDSTRCLTYSEFEAIAGGVAGAVRAANVGEGPIAILLDNEARFPAAILGLLAAGRACVPLDAGHPIERNARIMKHAGVVALISTAALAERAGTWHAKCLPMLDVDKVAADPQLVGTPAPRPDDVACILYTSGSTGTPKGVFQNHRGVLCDAAHSVNVGPVKPDDHIALFYSPTVVVGLRTMLAGILSGAALEVLPPLALGAAGLVREIKRRRVTRLNLSPSLFRHIVGALGDREHLDSVHTVMLGGERVDWSDFDLLQRACAGNAKLYVHLGATECWTIHTQWCVDPAVRTANALLPVGYPLAERHPTVLAVDGAEAKDGDVGEIVVTSRYLALGYWREAELTSEAFSEDPAEPHKRRFRTGDLARRRADGLMEFVGRKDQQLKLHGYRIEPDEIECALKACSGIANAAVLVRRDAAGVPTTFVGYAQRQPGEHSLLPRHVLAMLSRRLPRHMMPAEVVLVDKLPWLANFKIDRMRLAQIDAARLNARAGAAQSDLIDELIEVFQRVTNVSGATANDNMRSLGGDSLQTLEVTQRIARRFHIEVSQSEDDATRTIAEWAQDIVRRRADKSAMSELEI
jgi:amino acid adenylation domain-containing protein